MLHCTLLFHYHTVCGTTTYGTGMVCGIIITTLLTPPTEPGILPSAPITSPVIVLFAQSLQIAVDHFSTRALRAMYWYLRSKSSCLCRNAKASRAGLIHFGVQAHAVAYCVHIRYTAYCTCCKHCSVGRLAVPRELYAERCPRRQRKYGMH